MYRIVDLISVLPPPVEPLECPSPAEWERCEASLGTVLPDDYKSFLATYGTGTIDQFLWILNPGAQNEYLELTAAVRRNLDALRTTVAQSPERFPIPIHPSHGGFLPFGLSDNGDTLYWVTAGEPNRWTVAVMGPRAPEVFRFEGNMVSFLVSVLRGDTVCDVFPDDFPDDGPVSFVAAVK